MSNPIINTINVGGVDFDITSQEVNLAPIETGQTSEHSYVAGKYVVVNGLLYKTITTIAVGDLFEEDVNIESTTTGDELENKIKYNGAATNITLSLSGDVLTITTS